MNSSWHWGERETSVPFQFVRGSTSAQRHEVVTRRCNVALYPNIAGSGAFLYLAASVTAGSRHICLV